MSNQGNRVTSTAENSKTQADAQAKNVAGPRPAPATQDPHAGPDGKPKSDKPEEKPADKPPANELGMVDTNTGKTIDTPQSRKMAQAVSFKDVCEQIGQGIEVLTKHGLNGNQAAELAFKIFSQMGADEE